MTRIKSSNVNISGSFVVPIDQGIDKQLQAALDKEKEIISRGEQKAIELISEAQQRAAQIIEEATNNANSQVSEIIQQAHDEGFNAGYKEGCEQINQELQDKIMSVDAFAKSKFELKNSIIKSAHLDIINLVTAIAEKVCTKAVQTDTEVLKEITANAIVSLKDKENITIIINPQMAEKIYSISDDLKVIIPQLSSIKIVEDTSVSPDGTIVESPLSRIDSRVKSQIDEIAEKLMVKLNSTPDEELEDS